MPFQPINFANISPQHSALADVLGTYMKGYQESQIPKETAMKQEQQRIANETAKTNLQYLPGEKEMAKSLNAMRLNLGKVKTEGAKLDLEKIRSDMERMKQFREMLSGASGQNQTQPQQRNDYQQTEQPQGFPYQQQQPQGIPFRTQEQREQLPEQVTQPQMKTNQSENGSTILDPGNEQLYKLDELYNQNPKFKKEFNDLGFTQKTSVKSDPGTGQVFIEKTLPSGKIELRTIEAGRKPEDIKRAIELAKADVKTYAKVNEKIAGLGELKDNVEYIDHLLEQNKDSANVIGPMNKWITKIAGTPEQKALLGEYANTTGNVMLTIAGDLPGAFTGRDMSFVKGMKANDSDQFAEFYGKNKAMKLITEQGLKRVELISKYIDNGMSAPEAMKKARAETDFSKLKPKIDQIMSGVRNKTHPFSKALKEKGSGGILTYNPETGRLE